MRLLARFVDTIIAIVIYFAVSIPFGVARIGRTGTVNESLGTSIGLSLLSGALVALLVLGYEVLLVGTRGQTLGKMATGIKIVHPDGTSLTIGDAAKRHSPSIALWLIGAIPLVGLLGILGGLVLAIVNIVMVFSSQQSLYDKIGDTVVIATR